MLSNKPTSRETGQTTEQFAATYLAQNGLELVTRNFHCKLGELDLIMKDNDTLVFIEVKYRRSNNFGGAISAITTTKQQKIHKTASFYLQKCGLNEYTTPCRFDVIALQGNIKAPQVSWLKNVF